MLGLYGNSLGLTLSEYLIPSSIERLPFDHVMLLQQLYYNLHHVTSGIKFHNKPSHLNLLKEAGTQPDTTNHTSRFYERFTSRKMFHTD